MLFIYLFFLWFLRSKSPLHIMKGIGTFYFSFLRNQKCHALKTPPVFFLNQISLVSGSVNLLLWITIGTKVLKHCSRPGHTLHPNHRIFSIFQNKNFFVILFSWLLLCIIFFYTVFVVGGLLLFFGGKFFYLSFF